MGSEKDLNIELTETVGADSHPAGDEPDLIKRRMELRKRVAELLLKSILNKGGEGDGDKSTVN
jgi:hypothetical protein